MMLWRWQSRRRSDTLATVEVRLSLSDPKRPLTVQGVRPRATALVSCLMEKDRVDEPMQFIYYMTVTVVQV